MKKINFKKKNELKLAAQLLKTFDRSQPFAENNQNKKKKEKKKKKWLGEKEKKK